MYAILSTTGKALALYAKREHTRRCRSFIKSVTLHGTNIKFLWEVSKLFLSAKNNLNFQLLAFTVEMKAE
jgi:hypothetical protein